MFWYFWRDPKKRLQWKGCKQLYLILQLVTKLQLSIFIWDVLFAKGVLFVFAKGAKCGIIFEQLFTKAGKYVYCLYSLWGFEGMSPWWLDLKHQRYLQQPSLTFLNGYLAGVLGSIYNSWPCIHIYLEGITKLPIWLPLIREVPKHQSLIRLILCMYNVNFEPSIPGIVKKKWRK